MFAMNATSKPRAMAAYTGSSLNTSRERVLRSLHRTLVRRSVEQAMRRTMETSIDSFAKCWLLADASEEARPVTASAISALS